MGTFVPRLVALTVVWLLATAALTYAAAQKISAPSATPAATTTAAAAPALLTVPDVRHQAYTFAKGTLSDAGFAWKVSGAVKGYASNTVVSQTPAPGTQVVDTGAPLIVLTLSRSGAQLGMPESASAVAGTRIRLAALAAAEVNVPARTAAKKTVKKAAPKVVKTAPTAAKAKAKPKPSKTPTRTPQRPPAFVVPGARREPLTELPLTMRANKLMTWLGRHPEATDANVQHWLYQHAWIVAGARMGWWHGASALKILIAADDRVWALWGIGARSEAIAKQALAEVEARTK
jgi:PASTA domain